MRRVFCIVGSLAFVAGVGCSGSGKGKLAPPDTTGTGSSGGSGSTAGSTGTSGGSTGTFDGGEPTDSAVAYQINIAHTGNQPDDTLAPPLKMDWAIDLGGAMSYPLIVNGLAYVTVLSTGHSGTKLYALDLATGAVRWGPTDLGGSAWSGLCYDRGAVFTVNNSGLVQAFDAARGTSTWAAQMPGQTSFSSAPTASNGILYVGGAGSGGTLYAVDENSGAVLWRMPMANGDESSPAIGGDGVYVSYACNAVYKFDLATGSLLWNYSTGCEGGGGKTPALIGNSLYVRDSTSDLVLDATHGTVQRAFSAEPIPAFQDENAGYFVTGNSLIKQALADGSTTWTFSAEDAGFETPQLNAPLVVNGWVFVGSSLGRLYAINPSTGMADWSTTLDGGIAGPDEQNVSQPLTGMAAGGGMLLVPAGGKLYAFVGPVDGGGSPDAGALDGGSADAGMPDADAGPVDAGPPDAGAPYDLVLYVPEQKMPVGAKTAAAVDSHNNLYITDGHNVYIVNAADAGVSIDVHESFIGAALTDGGFDAGPTNVTDLDVDVNDTLYALNSATPSTILTSTQVDTISPWLSVPELTKLFGIQDPNRAMVWNNGIREVTEAGGEHAIYPGQPYPTSCANPDFTMLRDGFVVFEAGCSNAPVEGGNTLIYADAGLPDDQFVRNLADPAHDMTLSPSLTSVARYPGGGIMVNGQKSLLYVTEAGAITPYSTNPDMGTTVPVSGQPAGFAGYGIAVGPAGDVFLVNADGIWVAHPRPGMGPGAGP